MKRLFFFLIVVLAPGLAFSFSCRPQVAAVWTELSPGVSWTKYDLAFTPYDKNEHRWSTDLSRSVTVRAAKIDLEKNKLRFLSPENLDKCNPPQDRHIRNVIVDSKLEILAAINASFFVMPAGRILGMALDENKIWSNDLSSQTISSSGVFGILNGEYFLETTEDMIKEFGPIIQSEAARDYSFAIQAYPRLVQKNEVAVSDGVMNVRLPRTSIGVDLHSSFLILVTIDAKGINDKTGMTLYEYAHFLKDEQCAVPQKMALNLDGGGSTAFALPSVNLFEQVDRCRHLGNILTVQKR